MVISDQSSALLSSEHYIAVCLITWWVIPTRAHSEGSSRDLMARYKQNRLYKYFARGSSFPMRVSSLTQKELKEANTRAHMRKKVENWPKQVQRLHARRKSINNNIGKYAVENGPAMAVRHLSQVLSRRATARRLKSEYQLKMKELKNSTDCDDQANDKNAGRACLGRPLLLGQELDKYVQDYINALRGVGGVVNTAIVLAAASGIVAARDSKLLREHGGHIEITKAWAKSPDGVCQLERR